MKGYVKAVCRRARNKEGISGTSLCLRSFCFTEMTWGGAFTLPLHLAALIDITSPGRVNL